MRTAYRRFIAFLCAGIVVLFGWMVQQRFLSKMTQVSSREMVGSRAEGIPEGLKVQPFESPIAIDEQSIPFPEGAKCFQKKSQPDVWGGRFYGLYSCRMQKEEVFAFYEQKLASGGWSKMSVMSDFNDGGMMAKDGIPDGKLPAGKIYTRGNQMIWLNVFSPNKNKDGDGCDFRVSLLSRPYRYSE